MKSLLVKVLGFFGLDISNGFKAAFSLLGPKIRLVIEYVLIATVIGIAGVAFTLWMQNGKIQKDLSSTKGRLVAVEVAKVQADAVIGELQKDRVKDATTIQALITDYRQLYHADTQMRSKIRSLGESNETVQKWLDSPVPPELGCLLDESSCGAPGDQAGNSRTAERTVQRTKG